MKAYTIEYYINRPRFNDDTDEVTILAHNMFNALKQFQGIDFPPLATRYDNRSIKKIIVREIKGDNTK